MSENVQVDPQWKKEHDELRAKARRREGLWYCERCSLFCGLEQLQCPICKTGAGNKFMAIDLNTIRWVIQSFDQANTNGAIEALGNRGKIVSQAIEALRLELQRKGIDPYGKLEGTAWVER